MIKIRLTGETREEVEEKIKEYMKSWAPAGYGTTFGAPKLEGDIWVAYGHRYESCD